MLYKALGFAVWKGAKLYLRRRYGHLVPPPKLVAVVIVAAGVAGLVAANARRDAAHA